MYAMRSISTKQDEEGSKSRLYCMTHQRLTSARAPCSYELTRVRVEEEWGTTVEYDATKDCHRSRKVKSSRA